MRLRILIVDDEPTFSNFAREALSLEGYEVAAVGTLAEACAYTTASRPDVVILDRCLPDGDGISFLHHVSAENIDDPAIMMVTGHGDVENAVNALKLGATDYLTKPVSLAELTVKLRRLAEIRALRHQLRAVGGRGRHGPSAVVAVSAHRRAALNLLHTVAKSPQTPVLISGPSGCGKQVMAEALHALSYAEAPNAPFVEINCAGWAAQTMESELFGRAQVAGDGASQPQRGLIELAHGGTLFLDEVARTPPALQEKLLKFLDSMRFRPVGSATYQQVRLRVVATSSEDPSLAVKCGALRQDLYHRLAVFLVPLQPLRECRDDIMPLCQHFLRHYARQLGKPVYALSAAASRWLRAYSYPGNVRELRNILERAVILCSGDTLLTEHLVLPGLLPQGPEEPTFFALPALQGAPPPLEDVERLYVKEVLQHFRGHRTAAAESLGISYPTFLKRLRELGLGEDAVPRPAAGRPPPARRPAKQTGAPLS